MLNFHSVLLFPNKNGSFFTSEPTPVPPPCSNQDPPLKTLIDFTPLDSSPETSDRYREREGGGGGGDFLRSESLSGSTLGGAYSQWLDLELELLKLCSLHPSFCIEKKSGLPEQTITGQEEKKWHFCAQLVKGDVSVMSQEQLLKLHVFWQRCWLMFPPLHFSSACDIVVNRATPITTAIMVCSKILYL